MRKILFLFVAMVIFLAACGGDSNNSDSKEGNSSENTSGENASSNEDDNKDQKNDTEVSDTHLDNGDYVYEIKSIEQMESGFGDGTQILAIELSFTNNTDQPTSPWMSLGIQAEQETETTVETLTGANGLFPEDYKTELVEMGDTDVKPGATVDAVIGFEILYPGEPVTLKNFSFSDEVTFERIVETTETSE